MRVEQRTLHCPGTGVTLCYYRYDARPSSAPAPAPAAQQGTPELLFVHATGFHARCWDQVIARLPAAVRATCRITAVDTRGHGGTTGQEQQPQWQAVADDVEYLVRQLDLRGIVGVGHSMGGHVVANLATRMPERFAGLLLLDPTIFPPEYYQFDEPHTMFNFVAKRRGVFSSPMQCLASIARKAPYNHWDPLVLQDYCWYGVRPRTAEGPSAAPSFELCCAPAVEASFYGAGPLRSNNLYAALPRITCPVVVVRAQQSHPGLPSPFLASPTHPKLHRHFPGARSVEDRHLSDWSHFIPMEHPQETADWVGELVARVSPSSKL